MFCLLVLSLLLHSSLSTNVESLPWSVANSSCVGPRTPGELRNTLWAGMNSTYDKRARPGFAQWADDKAAGRDHPSLPPPDTAEVQLNVISVKSVDHKRGEFQLMAWLRQRWSDQRLKYITESDGGCFPDKVRQGFSMKDMDGIWKPDISIENEVKREDLAGSFWIYPNGVVVYARYVLLTNSCDMDLKKFPHDTQHCYVRAGTWLEDANDVVLDYYDDIDPVTVSVENDGGSNEWTFTAEVRYNVNDLGATQKESTLLFEFTLMRQSKHYLDFVIAPAMIFVIIGWATFYVSREAAPARVTMSTVCFLTNVNFMGAQLSALPRLDNSVLLLKFLTISAVFTFYTIIEYVLCNYLMRIQKRTLAARKRAVEAKLLKCEDTTQEVADLDLTTSIEEGTRLSAKVSSIKMTKEDLKAAGLHKSYLIFLDADGELRITDELVENFSRIAYPIAYMITMITLYIMYKYSP